MGTGLFVKETNLSPEIPLFSLHDLFYHTFIKGSLHSLLAVLNVFQFNAGIYLYINDKTLQ